MLHASQPRPTSHEAEVSDLTEAGASKCSMPRIIGLSATCPSVASLDKRNTVNSSALTSQRRESGIAAGRGRFQHMQVRSSQKTAHAVFQRVDMQVKKPTNTACRSRQQLFRIIDSRLCKASYRKKWSFYGRT